MTYTFYNIFYVKLLSSHDMMAIDFLFLKEIYYLLVIDFLKLISVTQRAFSGLTNNNNHQLAANG